MTEIVLTCSPQVLAGMVAAYETAIEQAAGELPVLILWWGRSGKGGQGTIVLEWLGKVSSSFLRDLDIDDEVLDYSYYEDERVSVESEPAPAPPTYAGQETTPSAHDLPLLPDVERSDHR